MSPVRALAAAALLVSLVACSAGDAGAGRDSSAAEPTPSSTPTLATVAASTPQLDAIAVLGHSGATGTRSDPQDTSRDATENSWATGENPAVDSIYLRLAQDHPAMTGHNVNVAVDGSKVYDLEAQLQRLLADADPLPDVVIVQTIDNDMRCDGTDPDNYAAFGSTLDRNLRLVQERVPGVSLFLVSQWATVATWSAWAMHHPQHVADSSGTGPCDVFTADGRLRPAGVRSMQSIVDGYWAQIERVCAGLPQCYTDGGAMQGMTVTDADVADDLNHLSIQGHAKMAAIAWKAFPDAIKQRA